MEFSSHFYNNNLDFFIPIGTFQSHTIALTNIFIQNGFFGNLFGFFVLKNVEINSVVSIVTGFYFPCCDSVPT